jgi:hypothetical protein
MRRTTLVVLAVAALAAPASAQDNGDGFLFTTPRASFTLRGGLDSPAARGDLFDFVTRQFTVGRGDFRSGAIDAALAFRLGERVDLAFSAGYARTVRNSEFRDWVDNNDLPIQQATSLARMPLTGSLRVYLAPRGRSVGSFAWIPARFAPYIGAGGGMTWYRFRQDGDFIDFDTQAVFSDRFNSDGWAPTAVGMAGADYTLSPRIALNADARYHWAKAKLGPDFVGFDGIDLSGLAFTLGFTVRL